jgi:hypothetical protein
MPAKYSGLANDVKHEKMATAVSRLLYSEAPPAQRLCELQRIKVEGEVTYLYKVGLFLTRCGMDIQLKNGSRVHPWQIAPVMLWLSVAEMQAKLR